MLGYNSIIISCSSSIVGYIYIYLELIMAAATIMPFMLQINQRSIDIVFHPFRVRGRFQMVSVHLL